MSLAHVALLGLSRLCDGHLYGACTHIMHVWFESVEKSLTNRCNSWLFQDRLFLECLCFDFTNGSLGTACELPCKQINWGPSMVARLMITLDQQLLVQKIMWLLHCQVLVFVPVSNFLEHLITDNSETVYGASTWYCFGFPVHNLFH